MATEDEAKPTKKSRGVYEHPKGTGIWWIQYFDHGRRRRERVGRKSDAEALYRKRRTQILMGDKLPELNRKRVTFAELLDDVLVYAKDEGLYLPNYTSPAELLRKAFGPRIAESLQPDDFKNWIRRREVSPATFNRYRSFISLCYREGQRARKVTINPARVLSLKKEPRGRLRFLTRPEFDQILKATEKLSHEYALGFEVSIYTGMRLSEQFELTWRNVDLERREIHVIDSKNGDSRTIPMAEPVYAAIAELKPRKPNPRSTVFPRPRGGKKMASVRWFTNMLRSKPFDILDYTWHNNRHTFCSWLAIAGTPLKTIQELAGHRTIAMTARYSHLSPDHKSAEISKLVAPRPTVAKGTTATTTATTSKKRHPSKRVA